jgi:hypothetical protein
MIVLDDDGIVVHTAAGDAVPYPVDWEGKVSLALSMERWASRICEGVRTGAVESGWPTFADGLACAVVMDEMGRSDGMVNL